MTINVGFQMDPIEGLNLKQDTTLAIISGFAFLEGAPVLILGTEKGHDMNSRIKHNFGMAKPEGYRKSQRIMKLASKLNIPLICFIDTSGAYPGKDAEERGQAEAIAQSMKVALNCEAPCISIVIGCLLYTSPSPRD